MPPLLADFIYNRVCELKCEKFLTRPTAAVLQRLCLSKSLFLKNFRNKKVDKFPTELVNLSCLVGKV